MARNIIISALGLLMALAAAAQQAPDTTRDLKLSGFVDMYYRRDFLRDPSNNRTSFTNSDNSFELGMASVRAEWSRGRVGMVADLGVGRRAEEFTYTQDGIGAAIKQLYLTYRATDRLTITGGTWATHVGYESVDVPSNRNYSMSYMFSWGPFFHTGVKAEAALGKSTLMVGVVDPTDQRSAGTAGSMHAIAQWSVQASEGVRATLNWVSGARPSDGARVRQVDGVLSARLSDKWSLGYNGTVASIGGRSWWGQAAYASHDPSERFGLSLRAEYFSDRNGLAAFAGTTGGAADLATTLTGSIRLSDALTIMPEVRVEAAGGKVFTAKSGRTRSADESVLVAAVYKF